MVMLISILFPSSHFLKENPFTLIVANKTEMDIYRCLGQWFANRCSSAVVRYYCSALNVKVWDENVSFARVEPPLWALRVQVRNHESRNKNPSDA